MDYKILLCSIFSSSLLLGACSDGSNSNPSDAAPVYDFSEVDARLQQFINDSDKTEGISVTIVDRDQGTVHDAAFGDHEPNIVTIPASGSKFASVTLLMAIHEDESADFDIDAPISNYLPWEGVWQRIVKSWFIQPSCREANLPGSRLIMVVPSGISPAL